MEYFAQCNQDRWVLGQFPQHNFKGYFLDIGAHDGEHFSNTLALEKVGWTGICVEADPAVQELLHRNRDCNICAAAMTDQSGEIAFDSAGMSGRVVETGNSKVRAITFPELFEMYSVPNVIDYVSLDIEGYEYKALTKFPWDHYVMRTLTVEHNKYVEGPQYQELLFELLNAHGYDRVVKDAGAPGYPYEDWYTKF